ncbi:MAG: hypothetical protein Q9170_007505 [Blastenia crenularia]
MAAPVVPGPFLTYVFPVLVNAIGCGGLFYYVDRDIQKLRSHQREFHDDFQKTMHEMHENLRDTHNDIEGIGKQVEQMKRETQQIMRHVEQMTRQVEQMTRQVNYM